MARVTDISVAVVATLLIGLFSQAASASPENVSARADTNPTGITAVPDPDIMFDIANLINGHGEAQKCLVTCDAQYNNGTWKTLHDQYLVYGQEGDWFVPEVTGINFISCIFYWLSRNWITDYEVYSNSREQYNHWTITEEGLYGQRPNGLSVKVTGWS